MSIWGDMLDRGTGEKIKKEDIIPFPNFDELFYPDITINPKSFTVDYLDQLRDFSKKTSDIESKLSDVEKKLKELGVTINDFTKSCRLPL